MDVKSGKELRTLTGSGIVSLVAFSPNGDVYDVPQNLSQCLRCKIAAAIHGGKHEQAAKNLERGIEGENRVGSYQRATHQQRDRHSLRGPSPSGAAVEETSAGGGFRPLL